MKENMKIICKFPYDPLRSGQMVTILTTIHDYAKIQGEISVAFNKQDGLHIKRRLTSTNDVYKILAELINVKDTGVVVTVENKTFLYGGIGLISDYPSHAYKDIIGDKYGIITDAKPAAGIRLGALNLSNYLGTYVFPKHLRNATKENDDIHIDFEALKAEYLTYCEDSKNSSLALIKRTGSLIVLGKYKTQNGIHISTSSDSKSLIESKDSKSLIESNRIFNTPIIPRRSDQNDYTLPVVITKQNKIFEKLW